MPRLNLNKLHPNWKRYERRPTWSVVSSRELSIVLGVSLQTICNWRLREILPEPEPHSQLLKGNKVYYRISRIRSWLENRPEEDIHWSWLKMVFDGMDMPKDLATAEWVVTHGYKALEVERPLMPGNFTTEQKNPFLESRQDSEPGHQIPATVPAPLVETIQTP